MVYHEDGTESYDGDDPDGLKKKEGPQPNYVEHKPRHFNYEPTYFTRTDSPRFHDSSVPDTSFQSTFSSPKATSTPHGSSDGQSTRQNSRSGLSVQERLEADERERAWSILSNGTLSLPPPNPKQSLLSNRMIFHDPNDSEVTEDRPTILVQKAQPSLFMDIDIHGGRSTATIGGVEREYDVPDLSWRYRINEKWLSNTSALPEREYLATLTPLQVVHEMIPSFPSSIKEERAKRFMDQAVAFRREYCRTSRDQYQFMGASHF
ncbi:uncharacterized protein L201_006769 [Kwoniella dendrophila CBS 6074]|uniref:Uncharacterized protein n=1 Tax=Kwoniella dendrophila CBS 6074 TaxID=1295534 RepID=A0AAX4K2Q1_9TREE